MLSSQIVLGSNHVIDSRSSVAVTSGNVPANAQGLDAGNAVLLAVFWIACSVRHANLCPN